MVIRDVSSSAIPTSSARRESILTEIEPKSGIDKREATASSYYPEEWPKDLFAMVHNGSHDEVGYLFAFIRTDRGW